MAQRASFIDDLNEQNALLTEIATRDVICFTVESSIGEAAAIMRERRISSIVVTDEAGCAVGIVTERNILQAMQDHRPHGTALNDIMSHPVVTVPTSTTILEAYQRCLSRGIRHLVITTDAGDIAGVVSETDFRLNLNLATLAGRRRVTSVAKRSAIVLPPSASLKQALDLMLKQRKSCVVAIEDEKPVGIVTERDVVKFYASDKRYDEVTLGEAMVSPVQTISLGMTTSQVAEEMLARKLRHLVVVDKAGRMAGLVSEHDLTEAMETGLVEERKGIEEHFLRTLINTIPDLVWLKDADGIYLACNARFEQLYGAKEQEIVGKRDGDFVDRELADSFRQHDRMAMEANRPSVNEEWLTFAADGYRGLFETIKTPMHDRNGKLIGILGIARDITERKQLEDRLEQDEHRLFDIYDSVSDCIEIISMDGVILDMNRAGYERQGYTREEMIGRKLSAFSPPEVGSGIAERAEQIKAEGGATFESARLHKNGTLIPIEVNSRLTELDGQPVCLGISRDITERKRNEKELREKEERLALATLYNGIGIWDWNLVTREMIWDDSIYALYHIRREDFSGSEEAWRAALHPDDLERGDREVEAALRGEKPFDTEFRIVWPDGEIRHIKAVAKVFRDEQGNPLRMLGTNVDITDRKQAEIALSESEHRYRTLVENSPFCIHEIDLEGRLQSMNRAGLCMLQLESEEQIHGVPYLSAVGEGDKARIGTLMQDAFAGKARHFEFAGTGDRPLYFKSCFIPIQDSDGKVTQLMGLTEDITERKRNEALNASRWHLAQFALQHSLDELLEETLNEAEKLTGSVIGFYHFIEDDQVSLTLQNWSKRTKAEFCKAEGQGLHYPLDEAGVWVDCVRERKPMIHNDYAALPHRKGLPEGHAAVIRELVVPVFRGDKITAILGVGNKPIDYTERDLETVSLLADQAWEIAERKRSEAELRKLSAILMQSDEPVTLTDTEARYVYANPAFCKLFGYGLDELKGQPISLLEPPGDLPGANVEQTIADARDEGSFHGEVWRRAKDGRMFPILLKVAPFRDEWGKLTGYIASITDLTEIKQMESALRESEKHFRSLLEHAPIGMATSSLDGHIIMVNQAFCDMLGRDKDAFEGLTYLDLGHPEDRAVATPYRQQLLDGEIDSYRVEKRFLHSNGQVVWGLITSSLERDGSGKPLYFIAQIEDITARKNDERQLEAYRKQLEGQVMEESTKFRALVEQSLVGIYIIQEDGFRYVNPGMADIFGYRSVDEIIKKGSVSQLVAPKDRKKVAAKLAQRQGGDADAMRYSFTGLKRDGSPIIVEVHGSAIEYQGRPAVIGTVVDITEERRSQEELAHLAEEKAAELTRKENIYSAVFRQSDSAIELIDPETLRFVDINDAECGMLGYSRAEMLNMRLTQIQAVLDEQGLKASIAHLPEGNSSRFENRHRCKDGTVIDVEITAGILNLGGRRLIVAVWNDISERKRAEEGLRITASVFGTSQEAILITDADNAMIDVNPAFTRITGYAREEVLGKNPRLLSSGRHDKAFYTAMWKSLQRHDSWRGEIWNRRKSGEIYAEMLSISAIRDRTGKVLRHVAVFSDISHIKAHEAELSRVAHYDALTGIPNRVLLADRMKQALARTHRERSMMAICYIDLDGFKPINDSMGHDAGDRVLVEVSRRIEKTIRGGDTVARLGGDEFVILLLDLRRVEECTATLERLLHEIALPIDIDGKEAKVGASFGVSIYPQDNEDADTLLRHADQAMYQAKQAGKHRFHIYDPSLDRRARDYNAFMQSIRQALAEQQFELYYQPKIDLKSKQLIGAEALIRWNHPERGLLAPGEFLPIIKNSDIDIDIGEWVVETALTQLSRWRRHGLNIEISVNISAYHLESPGFVDMLRRHIARHPGLPAGSLQIEVLETTALEDIAVVNGIIKSCRELGVGFALDDFGTGYSSLSYLSRLPIDALKIDQSFVRDMLEDKGDMAIVQGVIALARAFGLQIVAEGIETDEHYGTLVELGCEVGQGYGIARPMPARQLEHWNAG